MCPLLSIKRSRQINCKDSFKCFYFYLFFYLLLLISRIEHIEAISGDPAFAHELHGPALTINACNYVAALTVRQILGSFKVEKARVEAVSKWLEQQRHYCQGKQMEMD